MIDWWSMLTNLTWVVGLALAVAVFSREDWRDSYSGEGLGTTIQHVADNPGFVVGLSLTCLGAGLSVGGWRERILWILLAAGLAIAAGWTAYRRSRDTLQ